MNIKIREEARVVPGAWARIRTQPGITLQVPPGVVLTYEADRDGGHVARFQNPDETYVVIVGLHIEGARELDSYFIKKFEKTLQRITIQDAEAFFGYERDDMANAPQYGLLLPRLDRRGSVTLYLQSLATFELTDAQDLTLQRMMLSVRAAQPPAAQSAGPPQTFISDSKKKARR